MSALENDCLLASQINRRIKDPFLMISHTRLHLQFRRKNQPKVSSINDIMMEKTGVELAQVALDCDFPIS